MQGLATISSMLTDELESENSDPPPEAKLTSLFPPPPPVLSIHLVIIGPLFGEYLKNKKDCCINVLVTDDGRVKANYILRKFFTANGGFQLEFVSISWVINRMTCYNSSALIG